ncbi:hypothetical protein PspLS_11575 [Pyricularia sp. CBS 133598]|nr:hypothetical protein PspLS_11575 [Pyricularia sp. CBS 133598]
MISSSTNPAHKALWSTDAEANASDLSSNNLCQRRLARDSKRQRLREFGACFAFTLGVLSIVTLGCAFGYSRAQADAAAGLAKIEN